MVRAKHIPMLLRSEPIRGDGFYCQILRSGTAFHLLPVEDREDKGYECGGKPEPRYWTEVVDIDTIHLCGVELDQIAACDILKAGCNIA